MKTWVFNPHTGGVKISSTKQSEVHQRIERQGFGVRLAMLQTEISFFERITARKLQFCKPDPMIPHDCAMGRQPGENERELPRLDWKMGR
jgi:hypothetical protein